MMQSTNTHHQQVSTAALLPFTLITFAISWGILGLYIYFPGEAAGWFGEITGKDPAFVLAVWAPAFAAFAVVLYCGDVQGARAYLSRLGLWRCPAGWASFLLLGIPLVCVAGAAVKGTLWAEPLFNASRGSILLPALFHFQVNNPLWPDAQPYDTYLFVVVAVLVVWINRRTMLTREGAITEVMAPTNPVRGYP